MPIPSLDFETVTFSTQAQRWSEVNPQVIPHPEVDFVPFVTKAQRWGDVLDMVIPHPSDGVVPYVMKPQRWGDVTETKLDQATDYYDPNSDPYVEESELWPPNGAVDVSTSANLSIPCGDRVATDEDQRVALVDTLSGTTSPIEPVGLDPSKTVFTFQFGTGLPIIAYASGSAQNGWSASSVANDRSGPERDILAGFTYNLTPPGGQFPPLTLISYTVYLEDYGGNWSEFSYSFTTKTRSSIKIDYPLLVAKDVIMLALTGGFVVTNKTLKDPGTYSITDLSGGSSPSILEVLPTYETLTDKVFLRISQLTLGHQYSLTLLEGKLSDKNGGKLPSQTITWTMKRTKADTVFEGIKTMATKSRGPVRGLIEAIMISDEKIGGDF